MLRVARLLLVASAAASVGLVVFIASRASGLSPLLLVFAAAAALFVLAARSLEADARRGKLLAVAGASALGGMGTLAGFGAGELTLPFAALGVLAAWSAVLWRSARWVGVAFVAYLFAGIVLSATRLATLAALPFMLPTIVIWPLSVALFVPGAAGLVVIFGALGISVALTVAAYQPPRASVASPSWRTLGRDALLGGLIFVGLELALAVARPGTSARFELVPVAVLVLFASGALLALGIGLLRAAAPGGLLMATIAGAAVLYILSARPTVECAPNGTSTGVGPWWLPYSGMVTSSGGGGTGSTAGRIMRGDGVTITYRCEGADLVEFEIRR